MNRDEVLKAYADLSAEDREAVRADIAGETGAETPGAGGPEESGQATCCTPEFMKTMAEFKDKMKEGGDPMSICKEMMEKCCCP